MFGTYHKLAFVTMATGGHSHGQLAVNLQSMMMEYQGACSSTPKIISPLRLLTTVKGDTKILCYRTSNVHLSVFCNVDVTMDLTLGQQYDAHEFYLALMQYMLISVDDR